MTNFNVLTLRERLIVALDVDSSSKAMQIVEKTRDSVGCFKIGLQLFIQEGPSVVKSIRDAGCRIFLDLKLHDISNTIAAAAKSVANLGVSMFTVHCSNGARGLAACRKALADHCADQGLAEPLMLGVTVLTSLTDGDVHNLGFCHDARGQVGLLAREAYQAGVRGLVASPLEAASLKADYPDIFLVTPGIRPLGVEAGDQSRITTPSEAIKGGADAIVVGRPIVAASDPGAAAREIFAEMAAAFSSLQSKAGLFPQP